MTAMNSENDRNKPQPPSKVAAIAETISTERAWQVGRRIYVRCAYASTLGVQLREIGAHWDREQRRLWVGSGKRDRVIALVHDADARAQAVEDVKAAGRWVRVPYRATEIRAEVKRLGGVYDGDRKAWALPSEESYATGQELVAQYHERCAAAEHAAKDKRQHEDAAAREAARAERRERVLAESGRTPTGASAEHRVISTRRMNKRSAWDTARPLGALIVLEDGRRGIVVDRTVWFTSSELASSTCWHAQTHDEAHWDFAYTLALVEPTAAERAADDEHAAQLADAAALHRLVEDVARSDHGQLDGSWSAIPDQHRAGEIRCTYGTVGRHDGGRLILTTSGELLYQHPGYYDDYRRTQRTLAVDDGLVDQARVLIDQGARMRRHTDQMLYDYEVIVPVSDSELDSTTCSSTAVDAGAEPRSADDAEPLPEATSTAARAAVELATNATDADRNLLAQLATAVDHDEDTLEEFATEDQFLSARSGVEVTLTRHDFTLPDRQVLSLWALDDVWVEVYEDADAGGTTTVYLAEPEAQARWQELVAEHQAHSPRVRHPEFPEFDEDDDTDDDCPGLNVPHCDECGSTTGHRWMTASLGTACDIDCYDAMADAPGAHATRHHRPEKSVR